MFNKTYLKNESQIRNLQSEIVAVLGFILMLSIGGFAGEWSGYIATESRLFPQSPLAGVQHGSSFSLSFQPEFYHDWARGDHLSLIHI